MHQYIALLRGINVGGNSMIRMSALKELCESLGFSDVQTYIQSGNVLFSAKEIKPEKLAQAIETKLESMMGRRVSVFVYSPHELEKAAAGNPFQPEKFDQEQICQLLFLSAKPTAERRKAIMALQGKEYRFHIHDKVLYYAYARKHAGNRRTINFEKVLGVAATCRTWKVIDKLIELAEATSTRS